MHPSAWLDEEFWQRAQQSLPIACADLVPTRDGRIGLILRESPFGPRWCQLGGRIRHGETVREALLRHLADTLDGVSADLPADPQPRYVMQWFTDPERGDGVAYGHDPRRHAVALAWLLPLHGEPAVVEGGEGLAFRWFSPAELDAPDTLLWPGTRALVDALCRDTDDSQSGRRAS